jgi:glycosyltransferase involved in cell wall biosynthesis
MRILFLNQYFPPDPAPTGILFRELADDLESHGHSVDFVDAGIDYRATQKKGGRMKRELASLWRMLREAKARLRADVVVSGTSPPLLAVVADRVARAHRARHFHWAMDVYPEIAVALGEIKGGSLIAKGTTWASGRAYRRAAKIVALDADMAALFQRHGVESEIIRPWVFKSVLEKITPPTPPSGEWTWIYSGNLGRAHEWETLLSAQAILEARGVNATLLFQGGGPSWPLAQARAKQLGLQRCRWRDYVPEDEIRTSLLERHALVVTQLPAVQGMLWPSKLGLVMTLPRPILFVGPSNGAIARELRGFPHATSIAPGDAESVAAWITAIRNQPSEITKTLDPCAHRTSALAAWRRLISAEGAAV